MAIVDTDIKLLYSKATASSGYSETSSASTSLGKHPSTTEFTGGTNALFDDVTGVENAALESEYRCIFVLNNHASLDYQNAVAYIASQVAGGADVTIAIDNIAQTPKGSSSDQAAFISTEDFAPVGVGSFSAPSSAITGLSIGTLNAGSVRAVWVKRTTTDSVALNNDGVTIGVSGETAP